MANEGIPGPGGGSDGPVLLQRLMPAGGSVSATDYVREIGLWDRPELEPGRVRVILNMVSTLDGRASLGGRSGPISGRADRELFHALRAAVDAVLVGAGTVRAEHYGRIIRQEGGRALRSRRGMPEEPLACIVSGRLDLDPAIPLLSEPSARVAILTSSQESFAPTRAEVQYVRAAGVDGVDLPRALGIVRERFSVHTMLCEGGPHLARRLFGEGLLHELHLSLAPTVAAGDPSAGLRILAGAELEPPVDMRLLGALRSGSQLFLRYGV
jgi:riboflavin biosynthesis pyrimidine reductase